MDNMINTEFKRKLPVPKEIKEKYPLSPEATKIKEARDKEIEKIFTGESDKFLLVIGPCSADRPDFLFLTTFTALRMCKKRLTIKF